MTEAIPAGIEPEGETMPKGKAAAGLIAGLLLLAACDRKAATAPTPPTAPPTPSINASMTKVMAVEAQTIWDITSRAFNARGDGLEASKISPQDWAALAQAGQRLRDRALLLAKAGPLTVAGSGETVMGADAVGQPSPIGHAWDAASVAQIQARIDANPPLFAQHAQTLAQAGDSLVKASQTQDVKTLHQVSSGLDEVCDGCHQPFWGTDEPPPFPKAISK